MSGLRVVGEEEARLLILEGLESLPSMNKTCLKGYLEEVHKAKIYGLSWHLRVLVDDGIIRKSGWEYMINRREK